MVTSMNIGNAMRTHVATWVKGFGIDGSLFFVEFERTQCWGGGIAAVNACINVEYNNAWPSVCDGLCRVDQRCIAYQTVAYYHLCITYSESMCPKGMARMQVAPKTEVPMFRLNATRNCSLKPGTLIFAEEHYCNMSWCTDPGNDCIAGGLFQLCTCSEGAPFWLNVSSRFSDSVEYTCCSHGMSHGIFCGLAYWNTGFGRLLASSLTIVVFFIFGVLTAFRLRRRRRPRKHCMNLLKADRDVEETQMFVDGIHLHE